MKDCPISSSEGRQTAMAYTIKQLEKRRLDNMEKHVKPKHWLMQLFQFVFLLLIKNCHNTCTNMISVKYPVKCLTHCYARKYIYITGRYFDLISKTIEDTGRYVGRKF
uniref:Uncharacterized protein n=1 Tax=Cacopsylla melanoneura TaxID=428564 RepID=A0A8D8R690_9HEMI